MHRLNPQTDAGGPAAPNGAAGPPAWGLRPPTGLRPAPPSVGVQRDTSVHISYNSDLRKTPTVLVVTDGHSFLSGTACLRLYLRRKEISCLESVDPVWRIALFAKILILILILI